MKNLAIIQARYGSSRLPGKVLLPLGDKTVLECVIDRVKKSRYVNEIIVATTIEKIDTPIVLLCASKGIRVFCGSENDVLDRYYQIARLLRPEHITRITADCPLLDPDILDIVIKKHLETGSDYTSNILEVTYPDGLDCEIMKYNVLEEAWKNANLLSQREHVTQYIIHSDKFKKVSVKSGIDYSAERWTIDTSEDYQLLSAIYQGLKDNDDFMKMETVMKFLYAKEDLQKLNKNYKRNEGLIKSLANDYVIAPK